MSIINLIGGALFVFCGAYNANRFLQKRGNQMLNVLFALVLFGLGMWFLVRELVMLMS